MHGWSGTQAVLTVVNRGDGFRQARGAGRLEEECVVEPQGEEAGVVAAVYGDAAVGQRDCGAVRPAGGLSD